MSDQIEQVSEQGFGSNIMESIKGVAVGALLFFASFWVLWMNEGRVDLSEVAKKSVAVKADSVDKGADGKFVSVTGDLKVDGKIEDPELLQPGEYVSLDRQVEMWAWTEKKSRDEKKKVGGSKEVKTTYTYEKEWTDKPWPPSKFEYAKGHENPSLPIQGQTFSAKKAMIGAYSFNPGEASLPSGEQLKLTDDMLKGGKDEAAADKPAGDKADGEKADADKGDGDKAKDAGDKKDDDSGDDSKGKKKKKGKKRSGRKVARNKPTAGEKQATSDVAEKKAATIASRKPSTYARSGETYLFRGTGTLDSPEIGDVRIGFKALKPGVQVTLFGTAKDGEVQTYASAKDDVKLFRVLKGSREEAIQTLATEHKTTTWILRIIGFLMMWFGLMMFFGPINAVLDVIPFLGSAGRFLIGLVMFPVSLVLSTLTILLSVIFHNTILLILFLAGMGAGGYFLYQKKKKG
jgi:hypothetical protein